MCGQIKQKADCDRMTLISSYHVITAYKKTVTTNKFFSTKTTVKSRHQPGQCKRKDRNSSKHFLHIHTKQFQTKINSKFRQIWNIVKTTSSTHKYYIRLRCNYVCAMCTCQYAVSNCFHQVLTTYHGLYSSPSCSIWPTQLGTANFDTHVSTFNKWQTIVS